MRTAVLRRRVGSALPVVLAIGVVLAVTGPGGPAGAAPARHPISGTRPAWATASADRGAAPAGDDVTLRVYLAGRDPDGLADYARSVSTPGSGDYQRYLSPRQVHDRFGPSATQIGSVTDWLHSAGLRITRTTDSYLEVRGTVHEVNRAFGTPLHNYRAKGRTYRAPADDPSVPASVADAVLTVTGLDNAPHLMTHQDTLPPPPAAYRNAPPCSRYYGQKPADTLPTAYGHTAPYVVCGYTPSQLRGAYGLPRGATGAGERVAIVDAYAAPTILADADRYARRRGDRPFAPGQFTQVLPTSFTMTRECGASGWYGEETLDVEAVHGMAPGAHVTYVGASSCTDTDFLDALDTVVRRRLASIVSNSWAGVEQGLTAATRRAYEQVFEKGAVEGIGFYFSSGDDGDYAAANGGVKTVSYPSSDPWVTSVGGTSLAVGRHRDYRFETGWGTHSAALSADRKSWGKLPGDFLYGSGGGTSEVFGQPFYQRGVVPSSLSDNGTRRVLPDVSAVGDPNTGYLIGETQTDPDGVQRYGEYRIGGTSLSCPLIAGMQAVLQQRWHGASIGFANPLLYLRARSGVYRDVTDHPLGHRRIADVRVDYVNGFDAGEGTSTSLRTFGMDSSLSATRGYDDVTGLGTPDRRYFRLP